MKPLRVKRVYEPSSESDGVRVLVDRLWPRGISKEKAKIDLWLKDISPSDTLRKTYHAQPEKWEQFCSAYSAELTAEPAVSATKTLLELCKNGPVTLLYAARDDERNNAVALRDWLERIFKRRR